MSTGTILQLVLGAFCFLLACGIGVLLFLLQKTRQQVQKNQACFTNFDRLTGIGNKAKFLSDGTALHSLDSRAVVSVYLGRYSELYNLFGAPVADGIITKFCHDFVTFASTHGGQAYRIAFNHLVLVVAAENGKASFLSDLKQFLQKAEQLSITLADASYTYDFLLQYGVYLLSESNDQGTDLSDILLQLDRKIQHSTLTCAADCIVLDGDDRPDWTLFRALENDAKTAWANQEFVPYYQPIFDINTGKVVGGELLARWQHPTRGLLKPNQFVPILERNGLIVDLDLYMLEAACKKIQYWLDNGILTVPLAINLSALNIHRNDFVDRLVRLVKKYDIPPVLLELELPEDNLLFEDNSAFLEKMQYLQNKGFSLSMGHFAEIDSSALWLLQKLPFDIIKIDYHFFESARDSKRSDIYVRNFLELAQQLGIRLVVTQLETAERVQLVQSFGCTIGKGFHLSLPLSSEEFEAFIR